MEQNQHQRRAAANEFLQSLNQLENMLLSTENEKKEESRLDSASATDELTNTNLPAMAIDALEEAVADIEQYFNSEE